MVLIVVDSVTKEVLFVYKSMASEWSEAEVNRAFDAAVDWVTLHEKEAFHALGKFELDGGNQIIQEVTRVKYGPAERASILQID